jgi:hypothetical protein
MMYEIEKVYVPGISKFRFLLTPHFEKTGREREEGKEEALPFP